MKFLDDMPIYIIIAALIMNISIGVSMGISFSALMVRCIVVVIVFGLFSYLVAQMLKNAVSCSEVGRHNKKNKNSNGDKDSNDGALESGANIDIIVPPIEDSEFENLGYDGKSDFIEMNPAYINNLYTGEQKEGF